MDNCNKYEKYKFIQILEHSSDIIINDIEKNEMYKDESNLKLLDNFIAELYDDFGAISSKDNFIRLIKLFFKKNKNDLVFDYLLIFKYIFRGSNDRMYYNFFQLDYDIFKKIVKKYSNVKMTDKSVPLDPKTKLILSDKKFNLSCGILNELQRDIIYYYRNDMHMYDLLEQKKMELILSLYKKKKFLLKKLLFNLVENNLNKKHNECDEDNVQKIQNKIINETYIDLRTLKKHQIIFVMIKLLISTTKFTDFDDVLSIIYTRSHNSVIEMISILKPELLNINLELLKKIIYYGRYDVFVKLYFHIPHKILKIFQDFNPFDLSKNGFSHCDDIHGGTKFCNIYCYDSEYEYDCDDSENGNYGVDEGKHKELINEILSICSEKNYAHVSLTNNIKKHWFSIAIGYENNYFASYEELQEIFGLKFKLNDKESIKQHIELCGKMKTWHVIKYNCGDEFLDMLFE